MVWMDGGFASQGERAGSWYSHGGPFPEGTPKAKASHQRRAQSSQLTPTVSGSTAALQQSAAGLFHLESVEVPLLQVLVFCKAVTDFAVNMGLDVLEVATLI